MGVAESWPGRICLADRLHVRFVTLLDRRALGRLHKLVAFSPGHCGKPLTFSSTDLAQLFFACALPPTSVTHRNGHFRVCTDPAEVKSRKAFHPRPEKRLSGLENLGWDFSRGKVGCTMSPSISIPYEPQKTYRCQCCRYKTLHGRGGFELCPICFWEDAPSYNAFLGRNPSGTGFSRWELV